MKNNSHRPAFTLVETVIAIGVVALLLSGFLAVIGSSLKSMKRSESGEHASRLADALENELTILRPTETGTYADSFTKSFDWIVNSYNANNVIIAYMYRGKPTKIRNDGSLEEETGITSTHLAQPAIRRLSDGNLATDLTSVEGPVYVVRLTQLTYQASGTAYALQPFAAGSGTNSIQDPNNEENATTNAYTYSTAGIAGYPEAVIVFQAEFFELPSNQATYVTDTTSNTSWLPAMVAGSGGMADIDLSTSLGNPILTRTMTARR